MSVVTLIARRELASYFRSPLGIIILAATLFIDGLLFNVYALGAGAMRSSSVLELFFFLASGTTMVASLFVAMRTFAEERQTGSAPLLFSSPVRESSIVTGKFLGAWTFMGICSLATLYMPALIFVHGTVTAGHVFAGYFGLLLVAAACLSIGMFGSALAPTQTVAVLVSAGVLVVLIVCWWGAYVVEPPLSQVIGFVAFYQRHFPPFLKGTIASAHVAYYLLVTYLFLRGATQVLEARRWK